MVRVNSLIKALGVGILVLGIPAQGGEQAEVSVGAVATREESGFNLGVRIRRYLHAFIYDRREGEPTSFLPPAYRDEGHDGRSFRYGVGYESRTGLAQVAGRADSNEWSEGGGKGMTPGSGDNGSGGGGSGGGGSGGGGSGGGGAGAGGGGSGR